MNLQSWHCTFVHYCRLRAEAATPVRRCVDHRSAMATVGHRRLPNSGRHTNVNASQKLAVGVASDLYAPKTNSTDIWCFVCVSFQPIRIEKKGSVGKGSDTGTQNWFLIISWPVRRFDWQLQLWTPGSSGQSADAVTHGWVGIASLPTGGGREVQWQHTLPYVDSLFISDGGDNVITQRCLCCVSHDHVVVE